MLKRLHGQAPRYAPFRLPNKSFPAVLCVALCDSECSVANPLFSGIAGETLFPGNLGNALHAPRGLQNFLEVGEVLYLNGQGTGHVAVGGGELERTDIRIRS